MAYNEKRRRTHYSKPSRVARLEKRAKDRARILACKETSPKEIERLEAQLKEFKKLKAEVETSGVPDWHDTVAKIEGELADAKNLLVLEKAKLRAAKTLEEKLLGYRANA